MNFALPSPSPVQARKRFVQPLWLATLGWAIACVASVAVAGASIPAIGWAGGNANPAVAAHRAAGASETEGLGPRMIARCQTCGTVEVVRTVEATGTEPAGYQLTVRLRDGSRRTSSHSDSARWRVGDSIMLIGGARLADRV